MEPTQEASESGGKGVMLAVLVAIALAVGGAVWFLGSGKSTEPGQEPDSAATAAPAKASPSSSGSETQKPTVGPPPTRAFSGPTRDKKAGAQKGASKKKESGKKKGASKKEESGKKSGKKKGGRKQGSAQEKVGKPPK